MPLRVVLSAAPWTACACRENLPSQQFSPLRAHSWLAPGLTRQQSAARTSYQRRGLSTRAPGARRALGTRAYSCLWTPESDITLKDFLNKHKPSIVRNVTTPWIWVQKADTADDYGDEAAATKEASEYLQKVTAKLARLKNNSNIPVRANKQKGLQSKKDVRDEIQAEASEKLKEISVRHRFVHGKWLIFAAAEQVDAIWTTVATSLINGPLSSTFASGVAKVSTSPQYHNPNNSHVICLYVPDVYAKEKLLEIMKILLGQHGGNLMGVKSDLYTMIGLYTNHPSGVQSTVWKNNALMTSSEMKELKNKYFAELTAAKPKESKAELTVAKPKESKGPTA